MADDTQEVELPDGDPSVEEADELPGAAPARFAVPWKRVGVGAAAYIVLIEVVLQFFFGQIRLPGLELDVLFEAIPLVGDLLADAIRWIPEVNIGLRDTPVPWFIVVRGAVVGSLYALIAMGMILIYRANRIINFAQAGLGSVAAVLALRLIINRGWPYLAAVGVALAGAVLLGIIVDVLIMRRFRESPRLIATVATIGIGQLLAFLELFVPKVTGGQLLGEATVVTPFSRFDFRIGVGFIDGNSILVLVVVGATVIGLNAFFRFTDMGLAVRASAENSDRALLVGIPVNRVSTVVWILAALLSSVGVFLRGPVVGLPTGGLIGPEVLLFGLAAAVVARMESLPMALAGGMAIGIVDQTTVFAQSATVGKAVMLLIIIVALLGQRGTLSRAYDLANAGFEAAREFRPIPHEMRNLPEVKYVRLGLMGLVGVVSVWAPFLVSSGNLIKLTLIVIYSMVGISLVLLTGWAGQISLGHWGLSGVGAAVAGGMAADAGLDFFFTILMAGLAGALAAVLIGLPALRIQGLFLAVTTLSFAFAVQAIVLNRTYAERILPADGNFVTKPQLYGVFDLDTTSKVGPVTMTSDQKFYFVCLAFLVFFLFMGSSMRRLRAGRVLIGVRDNPRMMQAFGINLTDTRLMAFAISGFIAAIAGALFAYSFESVEAAAFNPLTSIELFTMTVIGGLTSLPGAILGATYVIGVPFLLESRIENANVLATGVGLLLLLLFLPGGLSEVMYRTRDRYLRRVAAKRDLYVPSLVADTLQIDEDDETVVRSTVAHAEAPEDAVLVTRGVEVAYGQVQVLFGVDMYVRKGEILALLGTNGAGKSTVLKAITGLVTPKGGEVIFDGEDITKANPVASLASGIVLMPGGKAIFPTLTVREHLRVAGWLYRDDQAYLDESSEEVLVMFPRLRERLDQLAGNLSGGEQQMLGLAMSFIAKPKLLCIDELSLGLAPTIVGQLLQVVRRIQDNGTAIVLVEQSLNVALTVADRAYFLEKGEVRFEGATAELAERDDIVRSVFLTDETVDKDGGGQVATDDGWEDDWSDSWADDDEDWDDWSDDDEEILEGIAAAHIAPRLNGKSNGHVPYDERPPLLEIKDLHKRFGGVVAVNGATFTVREDSILGLIGGNGAGKTTIFDLISGYLTPDKGQVVIGGQDVTSLRPDQRSWLGLGRSFQDARLVGSLTVAENMALGLERHLLHRDHVAAAFALPDMVIQERNIAWSVNDLIELMNLGAFRDKFVKELSTGSRRIADLAMCMAHDPRVLLLDEPAAGVAQAETENLGPLMQRIKRETGCSILVIEHDMPLITGVSDNLVCLELGAPIASGIPSEVISNPRVVASYLGGDESTINRSGGSS